MTVQGATACLSSLFTAGRFDELVELLETGVTALRWLAEGYGYEVTSVDVLDAYDFTVKAAENAGLGAETRSRICGIAPGGSFLNEVLRRRLVHE